MRLSQNTTIMPSSVALLGLLLASLVAFGCTPRQIGATHNSLYASGRADFSISVAPPLALAGSGNFSTFVPSDVNIDPFGRFHYAVFSDSDSGPVLRHAHAAMCELNQRSWRWEKETWALAESFYYSKERRGAKYWTVQMMSVSAKDDWYSQMWRENGRETPEFWIAKRWSATPEDEIRIVAEYREPAPACMVERLREAGARPQGSPSFKGKSLLANCEQAIQEFSQRADAIFALDTMTMAAPDITDNTGNTGNPDTPGNTDNAPKATSPALSLGMRPAGSPDMARLMGRSELIERGNHDRRP